MRHGWLGWLLLSSVNALPAPSATPVKASPLPIAPVLAELEAETRSHIEGSFPDLPIAPSERKLIFPRFKANTIAAAATASLQKGGITTLTDGEEQRRKTEAEGLANALSQLNIDISGASQTVISEDRWIQDVQKVMDQYTKKITNVKADIDSQRANIKKMLKTKRKVENLILQKQLEDKLSEASNDLSTLNSALSQVKTKEQSFTRSSGDVQSTIDSIKSQLSKLQGKPASAADGTSSTESSDTASSSTEAPAK